MKITIMLQVLVIGCMAILIVIEWMKALLCGEKSGESSEEAVVLSLLNNRISLAKGSYYIGNSWLKSFIFPNYIHVCKCPIKEPFLLLAKVDAKGLCVSVLRGKLETICKGEVYQKDKTREIYIPRNQCFFIENIRINVL